MKRAKIWWLAVPACGWLAAVCTAETRSAGTPVDRYAALVNQRMVTVGEVRMLIAPLEAQLADTHSGTELAAKRKDIFKKGLDTMVDQALILTDFEAQKGQYPDRAAEDAVSEMIHNRFHNDRLEMMEALRENRLTYEEWRTNTKETMIAAGLRRQNVNDLILLTPRQVRAAYEARREKYRRPEKVKLRILVLNQGVTVEDRKAKRKQAEKLIERLKAGEDFAGLAKNYSEGFKASAGGDMGWVEPGSLRQELMDAAAALKPGEFSGVLEAGSEYYLLLLEARQNASVIPFEEVRAQLEEELWQAEAQRLYELWINRLKKKYYVNVLASS